MTRNAPAVAGIVVLTLLNLADLVSIGFVGTPGNPPAEIVPGFVLAVIGVLATVPAWRGRRWGVLVLFWARGVSTVIALVYFVVGEQPQWVRTGLAIGIVLSLVGLALLAAWWRRSSGVERAPRGPAASGIR
jgi:hypothetical protein